MESISTYEEAVAWMMQQLPMFSRQGQKAYKPGLENIEKLCHALGNPERHFKSIHIAGTNGKGSTSHMLAAVFQTAGYKTGLYTSPHLVDIRERSRINGIPITKQSLIDFINKHKSIIEEIKPSYFELNVALAFEAFSEEKVDIAIIETGLGGRWDSTNVVRPELSIITNISLDHTQILGKTIEKIASSKAGIIKHQVPVIIGESQEASDRVFIQEAILKNALLVHADAMYDIVLTDTDANGQSFKLVDRAAQNIIDLHTDLQGSFQGKNLVTAFAATKMMEQQGWQVNEDLFIKAVSHIKQLTGLRGRWDWVQKSPNVILDVGHNPAGISIVAAQLRHKVFSGSKKHIVLGFVADKDVAEALALLPKDAHYYFTQAQVPRAMEANRLKEIAATLGLEGNSYTDVSLAVDAALQAADVVDTVLITGSFFIVGEALEFINNRTTLATE